MLAPPPYSLGSFFMPNTNSYWSEYLPLLEERGISEAVGSVFFKNAPLNRWLRHSLEGKLDPQNALMADPLFEAMFPQKEVEPTYADLPEKRWGQLFSRRVIEAMPSGDRSHHPYKHQFEAFQLLCRRGDSKRESLIISSGTGSGKTECFLYPILEDLYREQEAETLSQPGIRGLILYPLNALINDQKKRLDKLFRGFNGAMRYCRYTGELPESCKDNLRRQSESQEVQCRRDMRKPERMPHLLLTNPAMLDRMLLRPLDRPLIEETKANKTFRWIVLDEAHNYLGSKAADLALLLGRMLSAFNVAPNDVHFIATSATVETSDEEAKASLRKFLMQISGADADHVHLIVGERQKPLPCTEPRSAIETLDVLEKLPNASGPEGLAAHLRRSSTAMAIRDRFIKEGALKLSNIVEIMHLASGRAATTGTPTRKAASERGGQLSDPEKRDALRWLDLLTAPEGDDQLLPLRLHLMMNTSSFIQACPDPHCTALDAELKDNADWPFGQPWLDGRRRCTCGAPLFPLVACGHCSSVFLKASVVSNGIEPVLVRPEDENAAKLAEEQRLSKGSMIDDDEAAEEQKPAREEAVDGAGKALDGKAYEEKEDDGEEFRQAHVDALSAEDASEAADDIRSEGGMDANELDWSTAKTVLIMGERSIGADEDSEMDGSAYVRWIDRPASGEPCVKELALRIRRPKEKIPELGRKKGRGRQKAEAETNEESSVKLQCPACKANLKPTGYHLRRIDAGYVNSLMPLMLDYSGPADKDSSKPMSGHKMLSFTDSRAATAMNGAVIEREGERCYVASRIYEALVPKPLTSDQEIDLEDWQAAAAKAKKAGDQKRVEHYERKIAELQGQPARTWNDLCLTLAEEIQTAADCVNNAHDGKSSRRHPLMHFVREFRTKGNVPSPQEAAEILLLREFGYRPVNAANLETCGLVKLEYRALDRLTPPSSAWTRTAEEWRSYLKILIDFVVRANHAIRMTPKWRALGGNLQVYEHVFLPADEFSLLTNEERTDRPWLRSWPSAASGRDRTAAFTAKLLGIENLPTASKAEKAEVDQVLRYAFEDLKRCGILVEENDGWRMHLGEQTTFVAPKKVWRFDGTNKLYDTIVSPPEKVREAQTIEEAVCPTNPEWRGAHAVEIPTPGSWPKASNSLESRNAIRRALQSSSALQRLIEEGAWNRFGTYALERAGYFAAAEHTAQVDKLARSQFEDDFATGQVNFLSCSTTMEMGVDLSGIGSVMLNGVPPHPANYLQRIGRAGRRGETRANAITFCRSRPLERQVFSDPAWALKAEQPRPSVSFSSRSIVQRHVNALVLRQFLIARVQNPGRFRVVEWLANLSAAQTASLESASNSTGGEALSKFDFRESGEGIVPGEESLAALFALWTQQLTDSSDIVLEERLVLEEALSRLVSGTCLESLSFEDLVRTTARQMRSADDEVRKEIQSFQSRIQEVEAKGPDKERYLKGLRRQLDVIAKRDFFSLMAEKLVLPSSIRVLNAVFFDPKLDPLLESKKLDSEHAKRNKNSTDEQDDSYRGNSSCGLPSREGRVGIFEYAPGASVVIEGTVHRSGGVMVDWTPTMSDDGSRNQRIVKVCECGECRETFFAPISEEKPVCPACGEEAAKIEEALIPKGFVSDDRQHLDTNQVRYYVRERPKVRMDDAAWTEAGPGGLRVRASAEAELMVVNRGRERSSGKSRYFAVCLACGFARLMPDPKDGPINEHWQEHRSLSENSKTADDRGMCLCTQLKQGLSFATAWRTDCLQLEFSNLASLTTLAESELHVVQPKQASEEKIESAAAGAAVALRRAVAEHFGVSEQEILWTWQKIDQKLVISLYDREKGGFTSGAVDALPEILGRACCIVKNCTCDSSCPRCIQTFDSDRDGRRLDRHDALHLFEDNGCFAIAESSDIQGMAGASTQFLMKPLASWLADAGESLKKVVFYASTLGTGILANATDLYDFLCSSIHRQPGRQGSPEIEVAACGFSWTDLEPESQGQLSSLSGHVRFKKMKAPANAESDAPSCSNLIAVAELASGGLHAFAICGPHEELEAFRESWSLVAPPGTGLRLLHGIASPTALPTIEEAEGPRSVIVKEDTENKSASFIWKIGKRHITTAMLGQLLWKDIARELKHDAESLRDVFPDDAIVGMTYSDRYLARAGSASLLLSIAKGAAESLGVSDGAVLTVKTNPLEPKAGYHHLPRALFHQWLDDEIRRRFFTSLETQAKRAKDHGYSSIGGLMLHFQIAPVQKIQDEANVGHDRILTLRLASGKGLVVTFGKGLDAFMFDSKRQPDPSSVESVEAWSAFTWKLLNKSVSEIFGVLLDAPDVSGYTGVSRLSMEEK